MLVLFICWISVTMLLKKNVRKHFYFANIDASFRNESGLGLSVLKLIFGMSFQIFVEIILESGKIWNNINFFFTLHMYNTRLFQCFFSISKYRFIIIVEEWQFCRFPIVFVFWVWKGQWIHFLNFIFIWHAICLPSYWEKFNVSS